MPQIFISYRRDDSQWVTRALWERLQAIYGEDKVFMDVESIPLGVCFPDKLDQELAKADIYLVMIGSIWTQVEKNGLKRLCDSNDVVRKEVEYAINSGRMLIPVLIDSTSMPSLEELPDSLKDLRKYNALTLSHDRMSGDVDRLIDQIGPGENQKETDSDNSNVTHTNQSTIVNAGGDVKISYGSASQDGQSAATKKNTTAWIGFASAILAALIGGLFLYFSSNNGSGVTIQGDGNQTVVGDENQVN